MTVSNTIRGSMEGGQPDPDKWFEESTMASHKLAGYRTDMPITDGPFATSVADDPVAATAALAKMATPVGGGNPGMNSPTGPGFDRALQNPRGPHGGTGPVYGFDIDEQSPAPADPMRKSKAPNKGVKKALRKAMAGRNLSTKDDALSEVVPPESQPKPGKPSNIDQNDHNRSAWVHSGVGGEPTLYSGQMKLGFMEDGEDNPVFDDEPEAEAPELSQEEAEARLAFASVPLALVSDPVSLFPQRLWSKEAADSTDYLKRDDAHPLTLMANLDGMFGSEWREWEPETIKESVVKEAGVDLSDSNMNKIMAIKVSLMRPDRVWGDWQVLEKVSVALDGDQPSMTEVEEVSPETLSHALSVLKKVARGKVSDQVKKYAAARLYDAGYVLAPPTLAFADSSLKGLVGDEGLRAKVATGYKHALGGQLPDSGSEDPVDIQVLRMMANHQYVIDKMDEASGQVG